MSQVRVLVSISEFADVYADLTPEEIQEMAQKILETEVNKVVREEVQEVLHEFRGRIGEAIKPRLDSLFQNVIDKIAVEEDDAFMDAALGLGL